MKRLFVLGILLLTGGLSSIAHAADLDLDLRSNEPTIAVNPMNPNNVVAANFDQGRQRLKISTDGGATFSIIVSAALPAGHTGFAGDDSLAFDATGRLFWTYLARPSALACCSVAEQQVNPMTGALVGGVNLVTAVVGNLDKEWIAADSNPASPFANNLYVVWTDFNGSNAPIRFARSTNQGATWTTMAGNLSGAGEGFTWPPEVAVAPNGDVYAAWHVNGGSTTGGIRMRRSTDGGVTFGPELFPFPDGTAAVTFNSASGVASKINGMHMWLQGAVQPRILPDPARPGNIYVVSANDPDGVFNPANDPSDIVFARSTDNGATWTRTAISQGLVGNTEIMPAAAIDASGNIAVSWYDNRNGATVPDVLGGTHFLIDLFTVTSTDGGLTFSIPSQLNTTAFDPEVAAPDRFGNHTMRIGEYNGLAIGGTTAHAVWTGNRPASGTQGIFYANFALPVVPVNSPPVLTVPGPQTVDFNDFLSFNVSATDTDAGDTLTFSATGLPAGLTLVDNGDRTATVSGVDSASPGLFIATITVNDGTNPPVSDTVSITVTKEETALVQTGTFTQDYNDPYTASATLTDPVDATPIAGKLITFTLGVGDTCSATTNASGVASCSITPTQAAGTVLLVASFGPDTNYESASDSDHFVITLEETTTLYTGPLVIANGLPVTLSGRLLEDGITPIAGRTLTLRVGSNSCSAGPTNASGNASCTIPSVSVPLGPVTVKAEFAGDAYYLHSSQSKSAIVFAFPSRGAFVLGNTTVAAATPATNLTFWGAQWASLNALSGGAAPSAFKGFAGTLSSTPPACGGTFTASTGNSGNPVAGPLPSYMGVLVSSSVSQSGSTISGNVTKIVVVATNPGYAPNPGNAGTGVVVATYCQ